jgi:hypothetical protein
LPWLFGACLLSPEGRLFVFAAGRLVFCAGRL